MSALKRRSSGQVRVDVGQLEAGDAVRARRARAGRRPSRARRAPGAPPWSTAAGPEIPRERLHQPPVALGRVEPGRVEEAGGAERAPSEARCGRRKPRGPARREPRRRRREPVEPLGERVRSIALVAGEDLVAAVPDERHGDEPAGVLADEVGRQRRGVARTARRTPPRGAAGAPPRRARRASSSWIVP